MMRTIALDDEPPALQVLAQFCQQLDFLDLGHTFTQPSQALVHLHQQPVDLLFLDVELPTLSGLDLHRLVPCDTLVIYTTAYAEHAVESYTLNAVDYLLKPFSFARFQQAACKAWEQYRCRQQGGIAPAQYLHLRVGYDWQRVALADLLYVQAVDDYITLHLTMGKPLLVRMTLKILLARLPTTDFVQVHRSYIISLTHLERVHHRRLLVGGTEIPVGSTYEAHLQQRLGR